MDTYGGENTNSRVSKLISAVGVAVPSVLFVHVLLLSKHVLISDRTLYQPLIELVLLVWLVIAIYRYVFPAKTHHQEVIHLVLYHVFCGLYLIFVCGLGSPVSVLWALLPVAAYEYLGARGFVVSMLTFVFVGAIDIMMHGASITYIVNAIITFVSIITLSAIMTIIADNLEKDRRRIAREQAKERLQHDRVTTIINNLADGIIATDANGKIDTYNAASANLLDTNKPLVGQRIDTVLPLTDESGKKFKLSHELKQAATVVTRDDLRLAVGDDTLRLSLIYSPIKSTNSQSGAASKNYIMIIRDITRQKSLEEERDEFISVVSHELRTPITIAEGALSNLELMQQRGVATATSLEQGVKMAHEQVLFLANMINDLSTLSRAERGVMTEKAKIEVEPFVHGIYNQYSAEAAKKGLHLNLDLNPQLGTVEVSELYLRELIQNFITNAIKYTKTGSVTLGVHKKSGKLTFFVKDTGIGISKSDQKLIFNKFFRSEDYRTRETSGTGLGLYVVKKISHIIGTTVQVESRLNHGSTFSFELPQSK